MNLLQEVSAFKEKLSRLKETDKDFRVFGAESHRYELFAPLSESRIVEFEKEQNLKLPEDYRLFLTQIGNGGAGPFYGIIPLEKSFASCTPNESFRWSVEKDVEFVEDSDFDEWHDHRRGVLEICEQGCGTFNFLVVNGQSYGTIWTDIWDKLIPDKIGFFEFYQNWLDRNLGNLAGIPLIKLVKVGMTKEEVKQIFGNDAYEFSWKDTWNLGKDGQIQCLRFQNVPAIFLLNEDKVVRINDQSNMLV